MQNLRSALQKNLQGRLSTGGASYVRFFYALPFALIYLAGLNQVGGIALPTANAQFLMFCLLGGISQIVFTFLLVHLFSLRNFAVGTTFSKTELVQIVILGFVLLGDTISLMGCIAIVISMVGILALSIVQSQIFWSNLASGLFERATMVGLVCGTFLGASVVFFRGASQSLGDGPVLPRAAFTLAVALVMQTIIMGVYLKMREPGQLTAVLRHWRPALNVGIAGFLTSIGWFTAFTLENAAYVRALGQVELIFTFIASAVFFKERTTRAESIGIGLITSGVLILVLAG